MKDWIKFGVVCGVGIVLALVTSYLAGVFILYSQEQSIKSANLLTFYEYWSYYRDEPAMKKSLKGSLMAAAIFGFILPTLGIITANKKTRSLFGDARFATYEEIMEAGLLNDDPKASPGIIMGKIRNRFIMLRGSLFALLAAMTRSGKGVSTVIPNLLAWPHSIVCMDIKKENWRITSGFREKHGQECHLIDPFTETSETSRYNPFSYVREGDFKVGDLISIGEVFYPSSGSKDSFWDDQARNFFVGLALYISETPNLPLTLGELLRQSSGKGKPTKDYLNDIINERNYREAEEVNEETGEVETVLKPITVWDGVGLPPLSMECIDMLNRFINTSDNTRSSILSSFNAPLLIWSNPVVDAATSESDFDLRDIRRKRMSIYIGVNPNRLSEASRLINLLFSQLINLNLDRLPEDDPSIKYQTLLLMDEMTAMGTIKVLDKANAYIAGYGLRLLVIIQNAAQLECDPPRGYGREGARTLISNHAAKIIFATKDTNDAADISKMLGTQTVQNKSISRQRGGGNYGQRSENESAHRRELLLPQEIREIGFEREIIVIDNAKPIMCEKIFYYKEPVFIDRLKQVSPSLASLGRKLPTEAQLKAAMTSGELAAQSLKLDMDTHKAKVQNRIGALTESDITNGVDLSKLAIDVDALVLKNEDNPAPEDIESFVDDFFSALIDETEEEGEVDQIDDNEPTNDDGTYDGSQDLIIAQALIDDDTESELDPEFFNDDGTYDGDEDLTIAMETASMESPSAEPDFVSEHEEMNALNEIDFQDYEYEYSEPSDDQLSYAEEFYTDTVSSEENNLSFENQVDLSVLDNEDLYNENQSQ